jgi:hypothetical protein
MTTKTLQGKVLELERRLQRLESTRSVSPSISSQESFDKSQTYLHQRQDKILTRTGGAWKNIKVNPLVWQRQTRKSWNTRLKLQKV